MLAATRLRNDRSLGQPRNRRTFSVAFFAAIFSAALLTVLPGVTCGQQGEVAKAAQQIADTVLKQGRKRVIVADFIGPEEQINELGRSLSDQLSLTLANANHGLEILPRGGSIARYT